MGKKILVIEDDPVATRLVEYVLKQRGHLVLTAPNGLDGLQLARKEEPDLIVLNVMLPGIDGFEVCHRLRAEPQIAQPLILMLSGRAQPIDIANGLNMGADDYLTKPAAPSEIVSRVESLLARKTCADSKMVAFLGPKARVGTTTTLLNVAIALSQMGHRVIAVDLGPYDGGIAERLGIKPGPINRLPETPADTLARNGSEPALVMHQAGVGVLRINQSSTDLDNPAPGNIDSLLDRFKESTDYFLLDLPFRPTAATRALLSTCTLVIIVSDYTIDALVGVKSAINILSFLGVPLKRIGVVITDPEGTFPEGELPQIKSYIEHNIAVNILAIIPHDINASRMHLSGKAPVIFSSSGSPLAGCIRELAQRIVAEETAKNDALRPGVKKT